MKKKIFETVELEIILLNEEDVIRTSKEEFDGPIDFT